MAERRREALVEVTREPTDTHSPLNNVNNIQKDKKSVGKSVQTIGPGLTLGLIFVTSLSVLSLLLYNSPELDR